MSLYAELGITPCINALDTVTIYGGSRMPDVVFDAMEQASRSFVEIADLQEKVGARIAEMTRNEAAIITSGCSAAILLTAAVLMTGPDEEKLKRLPDSSSLEKNEIVMMSGQRTGYEAAIRAAGARLVLADTGKSDVAALEACLSPRTAAIYYFDLWGARETSLSFEQTLAVANAHDIPLVVDAAAQLPPAENLWRFTEAGAAAALFSGGKGLRGPQGSGLILGKKWLVDAVRLIAAPKHGIGRSCKIGREEIVGLYTALKEYLRPGQVTCLEQTIEARVAFMSKALEASGRFICRRVYPGPTGQSYPRLAAGLTAGVPADSLIERLKGLNPSILLTRAPAEVVENGLFINALLLKDDEVTAVLRGILEQTAALAAESEENR